MKRKFIRIINRIPLWMQLSFFMFVISTATILSLIYRNFTSTRDMVIENQYSLSASLLNLEIENLEHYISELAYFCIQPYYDSTFTRIIEQKTPASSQQLDYAKQQMFYYYYTRNDILEYELYLINQDLAIGRTVNQNHLNIQTSPGFDTKKAITLCSADSMHQAIVPCQEDNAFFTYYHSLFQLKGQVPHAIVRLQVNQSYLKQILKNHNEDNDLLIILNGNNELIFSSNPDIFSAEDSVSDITDTEILSEKGAMTIRIKGAEYLLVKSRSSKNGLQLMHFIPFTQINSDFHDVAFYILVNGFVIWIIMMGAIYLFTYLLTRPLKQLSSRMEYAGSGDFHTTQEMNGSSEIADLSSNFNSMLLHIDQLIQQNYIAKLSEKSARLTALEAQLNPHFLYNTLQAISTEALINDQMKIHLMITSLASNLRYTIKADDLVTLKEELDYLSDYIYLMKMRMGDTLSFAISTQPELEYFLIPKISLQALVENSVIHGKSTNRENIQIHVTIQKLPDNRLQISVRDDGCGISIAQQKKLLNDFHIAMTAENPGGIGLANLYVRLHLLYEAPADLQIDSKEGQYTNIILTLPCVKKGGSISCTEL